MVDQLRIKDLEIYAYHGVFSAEKELGQRFVLDVCVDYEMTKSARTGDLTASIHYGILAEQLTDWVQAEKIDLIETVAFQLVEKIFATYDFIKKVRLELKKPWAPVPLPLDTCSVTIEREKRRAFIGLGTNMGDKGQQLATAVSRLEEKGLTILQTSSQIETAPWGGVEQSRLEEKGLTILQTSSQIETAPWGGVEQDSFLNQVVEVETWFTPQDLIETLLGIELEMGRVREIKWGPRVIDLDLLYMEDLILYSPDLILPHPYVAERAFVLESLNEIAPYFVDPVQRKQIRQLWEAVKET